MRVHTGVEVAVVSDDREVEVVSDDEKVVSDDEEVVSDDEEVVIVTFEDADTEIEAVEDVELRVVLNKFV